MDGITSDVSGNLYVVDTSGKIFRINLSNQNYSIIADTFPNYTPEEVMAAKQALLAKVYALYNLEYDLDTITGIDMIVRELGGTPQSETILSFYGFSVVVSFGALGIEVITILPPDLLL